MMLLLLPLVGLVVGAVLIHAVAKAFAPVDDRDVAALHQLSGVTPTASTRRLFAAYLSRSRRYRTGWSVVVWMSALVLAGGLGAHTIGLGTAAHPAYGDLLLTGFGGYLLGAMVAELHHLRPPRAAVRMASLSPRKVSDYASKSQRWLLRATVIVTGVVLIVGLGAHRYGSDAGRRGFPIAAVGFSVAAVVVWLVVERTQRAIVERARPAMPDDLARGDDAIRRTSVETLSIGGAGLVAFLTTWVITSLERAGVPSVVHAVATFLVIGLFAFGVAAALRSRRLVWPARKMHVEGVPA
jgi:hypothetical protein